MTNPTAQNLVQAGVDQLVHVFNGSPTTSERLKGVEMMADLARIVTYDVPNERATPLSDAVNRLAAAMEDIAKISRDEIAAADPHASSAPDNRPIF